MDSLFSCRNCIHNAGQSLNVGQGVGFCLKHDSVIWQSITTTCKYLHRKDLPSFVVDEGVSEHAAEFSNFPSLVDLINKEPVRRIQYSEQFVWERRSFDPINHALAQFHKTDKKWIFIQSFASGIDGRRSIAFSSLIRRYVDTCETWTSSYRLFLGFVQEICNEPVFEPKDLLHRFKGESIDSAKKQALWDVVFDRISAIQEYGWHAGLEELKWASDSLNGALSELNWARLKTELEKKRDIWTNIMMDHAKREGEFFTGYDEAPEAE